MRWKWKWKWWTLGDESLPPIGPIFETVLPFAVSLPSTGCLNSEHPSWHWPDFPPVYCAWAKRKTNINHIRSQNTKNWSTHSFDFFLYFYHWHSTTHSGKLHLCDHGNHYGARNPSIAWAKLMSTRREPGNQTAWMTCYKQLSQGKIHFLGSNLSVLPWGEKELSSRTVWWPRPSLRGFG